MKTQKKLRKRKTAPKKKSQPFRLSSTSGHILPLQTIRQRLVGFWQSLDWPTCVKIIKANIAVTIALAFLLIDPIRKYSGTGGILASVAVEFVHPAKSYGFLAEDVLLGTIMCCVSASWSILAIYLSSLVRDPQSTATVQPHMAAVLSCFLVIGCFCLSVFRVKVEQANVGGMLSASIMVISVTSAVTYKEFNPIPTLQVLIPTLVGFYLIFFVFFLIFPENSTRVYVKHLIKLLETCDGITQRQVNAFLRTTPSGQPQDQPETLANVHTILDTLITNLILKKRMVRREPSFNFIAPLDVTQLTSYSKKLRIPIQGLGISRAMEENMRKADKSTFEAIPFEYTKSETVERVPLGDGGENSDIDAPEDLIDRPRSYYGNTDDEEDDSLDEEYRETNHSSCVSASSSIVNTSTPQDNNSSSSTNTISTQDQFPTTNTPRKRRTRWEEPMRIMGYWREDYDTTLDIVKPVYVELTNACSVAIKETVKRLRKMQDLDSRYQDLPFCYKYYYRWKVGAAKDDEEKKAFKYDDSYDPSVPLLKAIEKFQEHRLIGLNRLFTRTGVPRRILFLLLMFQFNLHAYAEIIYTITSFVYEMDKVRTKRRVWMPHISLRKWLFRSHNTPESFDLDTPAAVVEAANPISLQKTLSRRANLMAMSAADSTPNDIEAQPVLYKLNTPRRGQIQHNREKKDRLQSYVRHHSADFISPWRLNMLDPLDYHDPDVSYPKTTTQRFFYSIYLFFVKYLYTADVAFAFRAAVVVAMLTLPNFLESSQWWYAEARGQWAAVVAIIWMGPSVGSNIFGTMTRTVGTFIGAVESIIIWEISRGTVPGLIVLTFFFNLPWWMIYINGKFWKATGLFSLITISLIIGYTYSYQPDGHPLSVFRITWERTVDVLVGVLAALIISVFPYPRTGRVVLRHRISKTLGEIGALYSSFLTLLIKTEEGDEAILAANRKLFHTVAECVRSQIKGERVLLEQSRFEPTLRGVFPEHHYLHILQILENILNLMLEMVYAFDKITPKWRRHILRDTWSERKAMIAAFLTALHLNSNSLTSKTPLPPYVMRPTKARRNLTNKARRLEALSVEHIGEREYTYFSTYLMSSEQLAVEIELLTATVRELVGPDSVSVWLNYKH